MYWIVIKVYGEPGEETMSITRVTEEQINLMIPLIQDINVHGISNYPTGDYALGKGFTPEDIYSAHQGFTLFDSMLPKPLSGFSGIESVEILGKVEKLM